MQTDNFSLGTYSNQRVSPHPIGVIVFGEFWTVSRISRGKHVKFKQVFCLDQLISKIVHAYGSMYSIGKTTGQPEISSRSELHEVPTNEPTYGTLSKPMKSRIYSIHLELCIAFNHKMVKMRNKAGEEWCSH